MTTNMGRGSATIYEFPLRGRFAMGAHLDENTPATNFASPRVAQAVFGGAWYHEEAVREEAEPARKN